MAAAAAAVLTAEAVASDAADPWSITDGFRVHARQPRTVTFTDRGQSVAVGIDTSPGGFTVHAGGESTCLSGLRREGDRITGLLGTGRLDVTVVLSRETLHLFMGQSRWQLGFTPQLSHAGDAGAPEGQLSAPMPGKVIALLVEAGAEVPYVGTACPRTPWSDADREWLNAHGCHVQYRASLEQDVAAMMEVKPDLAIGTTPLVQKAKELGTPAIYFTNMVSARPLLGIPGIGAMAAIVKAQTKSPERFAGMVEFFDGVGTGDNTGYGWQGVPEAHPQFRAKMAKQRIAREKTLNQAKGS
jgi:hypothetical protein